MDTHGLCWAPGTFCTERSLLCRIGPATSSGILAGCRLTSEAPSPQSEHARAHMNLYQHLMLEPESLRLGACNICIRAEIDCGSLSRWRPRTSTLAQAQQLIHSASLPNRHKASYAWGVTGTSILLGMTGAHSIAGTTTASPLPTGAMQGTRIGRQTPLRPHSRTQTPFDTRNEGSCMISRSLSARASLAWKTRLRLEMQTRRQEEEEAAEKRKKEKKKKKNRFLALGPALCWSAGRRGAEAQGLGPQMRPPESLRRRASTADAPLSPWLCVREAGSVAWQVAAQVCAGHLVLVSSSVS